MFSPSGFSIGGGGRGVAWMISVCTERTCCEPSKLQSEGSLLTIKGAIYLVRLS